LDNCLDATPYVKIAFDFHAEWLTGSDEIAEDFIGHKLMKNTHIAIGIDIEFKRFELDEVPVWDIRYPQGRKIWLTRHGTDTGKLGNGKRDAVEPFSHQVIHDLNNRECYRLKVRSGSHTLHAWLSSWHGATARERLFVYAGALTIPHHGMSRPPTQYGDSGAA
jgi:hypothetical protein